MPVSRASKRAADAVSGAQSADINGADGLPQRSARRAGLWVAAIAVCAALAIAARRLGAELNYHDLVHTMRHTPLASIVAAFLMTALSYAVLLGTDWLAARCANVRPPLRVLMLASFSGYALGNAAGFGALSGAAVRFRIYSVAGLRPGQIGRIVAYLALSFTIGAPFVALAAASFAPA